MEDYTPKYYNPNEKYDIDRDSHSHGPIEYGFVYWPTGVAICLGCLHGTVEFITPGAQWSSQTLYKDHREQSNTRLVD
jgi:hypothetical protein